MSAESGKKNEVWKKVCQERVGCNAIQTLFFPSLIAFTNKRYNLKRSLSLADWVCKGDKRWKEI
jgi:hypothetical protein